MDAQELQLIQQAQAGDTRAFDQLIRRHDRRILQITYSILGNLQDAQDIYQETFLKAYSNISTFRFESELSTWLSRIAVNLAITYRKRRQLHQFLSFDSGPEKAEGKRQLETAIENHPENSLLSRELRQKIESSLDHLSPQQRTIFVLKHFHGYKIKEIAELLSCTEGTIKNQLFRAIQKVKQYLTPYLQASN